MNKISDEIVKIEELSLQLKNKELTSLYIHLCFTKAAINKLMLDNNISFELIHLITLTYEMASKFNRKFNGIAKK